MATINYPSLMLQLHTHGRALTRLRFYPEQMVIHSGGYHTENILLANARTGWAQR